MEAKKLINIDCPFIEYDRRVYSIDKLEKYREYLVFQQFDHLKNEITLEFKFPNGYGAKIYGEIAGCIARYGVWNVTILYNRRHCLDSEIPQDLLNNMTFERVLKIISDIIVW